MLRCGTSQLLTRRGVTGVTSKFARTISCETRSMSSCPQFLRQGGLPVQHVLLTAGVSHSHHHLAVPRLLAVLGEQSRTMTSLKIFSDSPTCISSTASFRRDFATGENKPVVSAAISSFTPKSSTFAGTTTSTVPVSTEKKLEEPSSELPPQIPGAEKGPLDGWGMYSVHALLACGFFLYVMK